MGLSFLVATAGCDENVGPEKEPRLTISLAVSSPEGPEGAEGIGGATSSLSQSDGVHSLLLTRVALVVRDIKLKRQSHDECDSLPDEEHDVCEAFVFGPVLLELPLDGRVAEIVTAEVPPDTYDEIEIRVHKPEDDGAPEDLQFLQQNPDFKGVSIRAEGVFDGEPFLFQQDLNEKRELTLVPPIQVAAGFGELNVTLEIDLSSWFRSNGNSLLDPRTANDGGPFEDLVEQNIRASVRAFEDPDKNGRRD
jgi:hypothetical protein